MLNLGIMKVGFCLLIRGKRRVLDLSHLIELHKQKHYLDNVDTYLIYKIQVQNAYACLTSCNVQDNPHNNTFLVAPSDIQSGA